MVATAKLVRGMDCSLFREMLMDIRTLRDLKWPLSMTIYFANFLHSFRPMLQIVEAYRGGNQNGMWPVALFVRFINRAYSDGNLYRHWPAYAFIAFNIHAMADS